MKLPIFCSECMRTPGNPIPNIIFVDVSDDGRYEVTCKAGHKVEATFQGQPFQKLFESATLAFTDGYYREAVASYAAALERFYWFFVRVVCWARKVPVEALTVTWKTVARQSERQLGAFLVAYLLERGEAFTLDQKRAEFRSGVIHKGQFPGRDEALDYATYVFDVIGRLLTYLNTKHPGQARVVDVNDMPRATQAGFINWLIPLSAHWSGDAPHFPDVVKEWKPSNMWKVIAEAEQSAR